MIESDMTKTRPRIDITGQRFGRLTAVSFEDGKWLCHCDCGGSTRTVVSKLKSGHTKSCSCLSVERVAALNRTDRFVGACECGNHVFAILTRGFVGLLSREDSSLFETKSWNAHRSPSGGWSVTGTYAKKLHREVLGASAKGLVVDHINGNPFDNRRQNLRACANSDNVKNQKLRRDPNKRSAFKGVTRAFTKMERWTAQINANGKHHYIGIYATEIEAARAYDEAAMRLHGEFARTNASLGLL